MNQSTDRDRGFWDACGLEGSRALPALVGFGIIYVGAILLLARVSMPRALEIVVALSPVPVFALVLSAWIGAVRRSDELQRHIQLEALAVAYPIALLGIMALGLLEMVDVQIIARRTFLQLWPVVFWLYFVGLFVARKRYR